MSFDDESTIGITEYISSHEGFFGIIRQRFSDFVVNELNASNEIVHLTSEEVIPIPSICIEKESFKGPKPPEISSEDFELLRLLSGQKKMEELKPSSFLVKATTGKDYNTEKTISEKDFAEVRIKVDDISKDRRRAIHQFLHAQFPNLNSSTKDIESRKFICIKKCENLTKKEKRRSEWPKMKGHVHFVLYKENIDTIDAINVIAGKLRLKPGRFAYAGTKDRRGKTSQLVSVFEIPPENLSSAAKSLKKKIRIGNFSFSNKPEQLGQSNGNHFKIVLREVQESSVRVSEAVNALKENGFINYFGTQRFGTTAIGTHIIGGALLRGDWKQAIDLILHARKTDRPDMIEAKKIWAATRNGKAAFKKLNMRAIDTVEGQMLCGLAKHSSTELVNALEKIPRNVRLMYIHAYQSYVWNKVVSKRIKKFGFKVLVGDLVKNKMNEKRQMLIDSEVEDVDLGEQKEGKGIENLQLESKKIHHLKPEEIGHYSITDVLMPLPGCDIQYPDNEIKEWYSEVLHNDNLSHNQFQNRIKSFQLGGAYRSLVVRPHSLEWSSCFYDDPTKSLVQSDIDLMERTNVLENRLTEGLHRAVILEFSLPSSAYATMALRELLKMPTSSQYHSTLNRTSDHDVSSVKEQSEKHETELINSLADGEMKEIEQNGQMEKKEGIAGEVKMKEGIEIQKETENSGSKRKLQRNDENPNKLLKL